MNKAIAALSLISTVNGASFCESFTITGVDEGEKFSNRAELEAIGTDNVSFHSFTTCVSEQGNVLGTQFIVLNSEGE